LNLEGKYKESHNTDILTACHPGTCTLSKLNCTYHSDCRTTDGYPPAFDKASKHDKSRMKLCIVCMEQIPRKTWRRKRTFYIADSESCQKTVGKLLTGFDPTVLVWMPTSICYQCSYKPKSADVSNARKRMEADKDTRQLAQDCTGKLCDLCRLVNGESIP